MNLTTCKTCHTPWAVVPETKLAHPGQRSPITRVRVPREDGYGSRIGGTTLTESNHWVSAGESVALSWLPDEGDPVWTLAWTCLCGDRLTFQVPAYDIKPCHHGSTGPLDQRRMCRKAVSRLQPLGYTMPSQSAGAWQSCPCCGHQGHHLVMRDGSNIPECQK